VQYEAETGANQSNMDSGLPLEDFFRFELSALLRPYEAAPGHVVDSDGDTCGDCDVVIADPRIAPMLHRPTAPDSRRRHFAAESTYGIIEVKQNLTLGALDESRALKDEPKGSLWDACQKVFAYKQLTRAEPKQVRWGSTEPIGIIFCYGSRASLADVSDRDRVLEEFAAINRLVEPQHRVDGLYVLNEFSLTWAFRKDPSDTLFYTLQHFTDSPAAVFAAFNPSGEQTYRKFFTHLWTLIGRTQLTSPDLMNGYGARAADGGTRLRCLPFGAAQAPPFLPATPLQVPEEHSE
jgi:hypothetical protein